MGFRKSVQYSGTAQRSEYWYFLPVGLFVPALWLWLAGPSILAAGTITQILGATILLSPLIAVTTRRLRDTGQHHEGVIVPTVALLGLVFSVCSMFFLHNWATSLWSAGTDGPAGFGVAIIYWLGMIILFFFSLRNLVLGLITGSALFSQMAAPTAQQKLNR